MKIVHYWKNYHLHLQCQLAIKFLEKFSIIKNLLYNKAGFLLFLVKFV